MNDTEISGYRYTDSGLNTSHDILLPAVRRLLGSLDMPPTERRLFELGCGNGSVANALTQLGWDVTGVDPSTEGIAQAQAAYPELKLATGSAYDDLVGQYGQFPVVLSLEVVEHVYAPRDYARTVFDLLAGGARPFYPLPIMGTGRTSRWHSAERWTRISLRSGIMGTLNSGRFQRFDIFSWKPVLRIFNLSG
ncbi:class I SAM-dependent methyltransferase [Ectothiorhodospira shaposhnikovii]|uniref:class I SAM-dependent methyltransferase n=1 Tax=Ectothiorhodospira shaposhnikovii TaxID=1054 RepID=UPI00399FA42C